MAASLLAMNAVFGRFFDVLPVEAAEPAAFQERTGDAVLHLRRAAPLRRRRLRSRQRGGRAQGASRKQGAARAAPELAAAEPEARRPTAARMADLSWENMVKEVFLDSETAIGLISTPPGPYPQEAVVPPKEMTHIRDEINRVTQSRRMLAHGLVTPAARPGRSRLHGPCRRPRSRSTPGRRYTGAAPKGFDRGWFVDDEKIAYPMLERARKLGRQALLRAQGPAAGPGRRLQPSARPHQGGQGLPRHRLPRSTTRGCSA